MYRSRKILAPLALAAVSAAVFAAPASAATSPSSIRPDGVQACNSSTVNWAATYPSLADWLLGEGATHCIGDKGTWSVPTNSTQVFCAGNNNGAFWYNDETTGGSGTAIFTHDNSYEIADGKLIGAGQGIGDIINVTKVKITGWTGSAGC